MSTKELVAEIERLPLSTRRKLLDEALRAMRNTELKRRMQSAAAALNRDYAGNKDLTAFTSIDLDTFYEAR